MLVSILSYLILVVIYPYSYKRYKLFRVNTEDDKTAYSKYFNHNFYAVVLLIMVGSGVSLAIGIFALLARLLTLDEPIWLNTDISFGIGFLLVWFLFSLAHLLFTGNLESGLKGMLKDLGLK